MLLMLNLDSGGKRSKYRKYIEEIKKDIIWINIITV